MLATADESEGGDPPCWAHLFDDAACSQEAAPVDLAALARSGPDRGVAWAHQGEDLSANLVVFGPGEGVAEHVNAEVDVLLVGAMGEGVVVIGGREHALGTGQAVVVPKGVPRATRAGEGRFAYLTCHRRRAGLWPAGVARPAP